MIKFIWEAHLWKLRAWILSIEWRQHFLARWGFSLNQPPDQAALAALHELRNLLRGMTVKLAQGKVLTSRELSAFTPP
jgi:hypothetical protein